MPDEPLPEEDLDLGMEAGFGRPRPRSVLESIVPEGSRILLREPPSDTPSPVLKPVPSGREGRYQVLGEIARGAVGVVFKGHDVDLGRAVAIKVLRTEHAANAGVVQRFVEEAQVGGQLQHPGIVPVYEMGVRSDGKTPWFAMKLVKGRTLSALLAERKSPADERRRFLGVFEQVCQTVAYAHSRGVVHRDLKPANVMVGAFGEVQVVDWGFAKVLRQADAEEESIVPSPERSVIATVRSGSADSHSVVGSIFGTPAYMPPEQARGSVDEVDERSDVFALGAMLCEILTGKPSYVGDAGRLVVMAARADLGAANARLSACGADPQIVALCRTCLVPAKEARPRNAGEVAAAVAGYLASEEEKTRTAQLAAVESRAAAAQARAEADRERERADHQRRQRRLTVGVAAAVLVTFAVTGGAWVWMEHDRATRVAEISKDVDAALAQSAFLRGRSIGRADSVAAHDALQTARRASELAATREVGSELRTRAAVALAETQAESAETQEVASLLRRAALLTDRHRRDVAVELLRRATKLSPRCAEAHRRLAKALYGLNGWWDGSETEIETAFREAARLDPDNTEIRSNFLSYLAERFGDAGEASAQVATLLRVEPAEPLWHEWSFDVRLSRGDLDGAAEVAAAAAADALEPGSDPLTVRLAWIRGASNAAAGILRGAPVSEEWRRRRWEIVEACMRTRSFATVARLRRVSELGLVIADGQPDGACAALRLATLRAGLGEGTDARETTEGERAEFRRSALGSYRQWRWFDRVGRVREGSGRNACELAVIAESLRIPGYVPRPGGFIESELMSRLPEDEREAWRAHYAECDRFFRSEIDQDYDVWQVILRDDREGAAYLDALRKAEENVRRFPADDFHALCALGIAKFRVGAYADALVALVRVDDAFCGSSRGPLPPAVAFRAMASMRLGRAEEARAALVRLRALTADERLADYPNLRDLVREAETLIEGRSPDDDEK